MFSCTKRKKERERERERVRDRDRDRDAAGPACLVRGLQHGTAAPRRQRL